MIQLIRASKIHSNDGKSDCLLFKISENAFKPVILLPNRNNWEHTNNVKTYQNRTICNHIIIIIIIIIIINIINYITNIRFILYQFYLTTSLYIYFSPNTDKNPITVLKPLVVTLSGLFSLSLTMLPALT